MVIVIFIQAVSTSFEPPEDVNEFTSTSVSVRTSSYDVGTPSGSSNNDSNMAFNFDSGLIEWVASPLLEEAAPLNASYPQNLQELDGNEDCSEPEVILNSRRSSHTLVGPVVLAHNPSLKQKLAAANLTRPILNRSASECGQEQDGNMDNLIPSMARGDFGGVEGEQVPLDPVVHPSEEEQEEGMGKVSRSTNTSQRRRKIENSDISPMHERVAPSLASKNLLVKVVKADFIELKSKLLFFKYLCEFL